MGLDKTGYEKRQKPIPTEGIHLAMCYSIIDVGTHMETFQGQEPKAASKVHISWELPNSKAVFNPDKGEQPMALFQEYTVAAGDKAKLPKMLCSWGKMPTLTSISSKLLQAFLGQACMISVVHNPDKQKPEIKYANIGLKGLQVMPLMAGMVKPTTTINPIMFFNLDEFSWEKYNLLPKHIQEKITKSLEWSGILAKHPKPAETMASALGYAQPQQSGMQPNVNFGGEVSAAVVMNDGSAPAF